MVHEVTLTRLPLSRWRWLAAAASVLWLGGVGWGWAEMIRYGSTSAGPMPGASVAAWPSDSRLPRAAAEQTLVVFLHPKCPCSRATLTQLERLFDPVHHPTAAHPAVVVVAATPANPTSNWTNSPTIRRALALPRADLFVDQDGVEAARFGAADSGTVMLFDAAGKRQFAGGVTLGRGHEGPSPGGDALAALLAGQSVAAETCPAFGCRMVRPAAAITGLSSQPAVASAGRAETPVTTHNRD